MSTETTPCGSSSSSASLIDSIDFQLLSETAETDLDSLDIQRLPNVLLTNGLIYDLLAAFDQVTTKDSDARARLLRVLPLEKAEEMGSLSEKQLIDKLIRHRKGYKKVYNNTMVTVGFLSVYTRYGLRNRARVSTNNSAPCKSSPWSWISRAVACY